jgi:hypothetical protein
MTDMHEIPPLPVGITPLKTAALHGGGSWLYRFDNGHGASVVCHDGSYGHEDGLFELMVVQFKYQDRNKSEWGHPTRKMLDSIRESEPSLDSGGLMGWLDLDEVARVLGTIRGWSNPYYLPS